MHKNKNYVRSTLYIPRNNDFLCVEEDGRDTHNFYLHQNLRSHKVEKNKTIAFSCAIQ